MSSNIDYFNFVIYQDDFKKYDLINPSYEYDINNLQEIKMG